MQDTKNNGYMKLGSNIAYVLDDRSLFLPTEYKVLQSQSCFAKTMKMLFNNKIQFFYYIQDLQPLLSLLPQLKPIQFEGIVTELFAKVISIRQNGFLSCESIDVSLEHIYIKPVSNQVYLLYIPAKQRMFDCYANFESKLRNVISKAVYETPALSKAPDVSHLISDISDGTVSLKTIYKKLMKGFQNDKTETLRLISLDSSKPTEIVISEDEFIIGRNNVLIDDIGTIDKDISRKHCKICHSNHSFSIFDLDSTNGTCVNGRMLQPRQVYQIHSGDIIRIAKWNFRVEIK